MKKRLVLLLALVAIVTSACGYDQTVPPPPRLPSPTPTPTVTIVTLTFRNQSHVTVCSFYAPPLGSETWGDDLLGGEAAEPGDTRTFDLPASTYSLMAFDCDGDELVAVENVDLSQPVEWVLNDAVLAGGLDSKEAPRFGEADLEPGFAPDPYAVDLSGGGDIEVALLDLGARCAGYTSSAPDFRINWWGDSGRLRVFFIADGGVSATLVVDDPGENWLCGDALIEIESAEGGQYDVWVGSPAPGERIEGALYVTGQDYRPDNLP